MDNEQKVSFLTNAIRNKSIDKTSKLINFEKFVFGPTYLGMGADGSVASLLGHQRKRSKFEPRLVLTQQSNGYLTKTGEWRQWGNGLAIHPTCRAGLYHYKGSTNPSWFMVLCRIMAWTLLSLLISVRSARSLCTVRIRNMKCVFSEMDFAELLYYPRWCGGSFAFNSAIQKFDLKSSITG